MQLNRVSLLALTCTQQPESAANTAGRGSLDNLSVWELQGQLQPISSVPCLSSSSPVMPEPWGRQTQCLTTTFSPLT